MEPFHQAYGTGRWVRNSWIGRVVLACMLRMRWSSFFQGTNVLIAVVEMYLECKLPLFLG